MTAPHWFSADYAEARRKFVSVAQTAGAQIASFVNPVGAGPRGEELATDVARFGPADAPHVLVVTSGTHGAEGFCGSGCQVGLLAQGWHRRLPRDVALVLVHAVNPHGFAWLRRVTEEGVDLNRNFIDHASPRPRNAGYAELHPHLLPPDWERREAAESALQAWAGKHGMKAFQAALSGGQYEFPDGLFYGGVAPTWSNRTLSEVMRRHAGHAARAIMIDLHTGLGPNGYGEPIFVSSNQARYAEATRIFGQEVTSLTDGSSTSAPVVGSTQVALERAAPQAWTLALALEYGTEPLLEVMDALRADHWLHKHGQLESEQGRAIKARIRRAFYSDNDEWKDKVAARCFEKVEQALGALGA